MELIVLSVTLILPLALALVRQSTAVLSSLFLVAIASVLDPFRSHASPAEHIRGHVGWARLWSRFFQHRVVCPNTDTPAPAIYACYPHGFVPLATLATFSLHGGTWSSGRAPILLASSLLVRIPLVRQLLALCGITDATRRTMLRLLLKERHSVCVLPGGVREMLLATPERLALYVDPEPPHLGEHRGFLRLAWAHQVPVVPVYHAGQHALFRRWSPGRLLDILRVWTAKHVGYPFPSVIIGPRRVALTTYMGCAVWPKDYTDFDQFVCAFYAELFAQIRQASESHSVELDEQTRVCMEKYTLSD